MKMKYVTLKSFIWVLVVSSFLISCNDDESPGPDDEIILNPVIGYSPATPSVGDEVTLDASASTDETNAGFTVEWTLLSKPENSTATLSDNSSITTTFTPDVQGDYQVQLEIANDEGGVSETETTTIAVLASGYEELSGSISSDRTLENLHEDPNAIDYLVTGNVSVSAVLTIEPGVVIHFEEDRVLGIEQSGTLIAEGNETDSIKFTTANEAGGLLWKGIFINSATSQNVLKYVEVSFAGNSTMNFSGTDYNAGVGVNSGGNIKVANSTFNNNNGYAVYLDDDGGKLNTFSNNHLSDNQNGVGIWADEVTDIDNTSTFINNAQSDVEIFGSTISQDTETTWNALSSQSSYTVSGNINLDGVLTVAPGAKFEMDEDVIVNVSGALIANGSSDNMIEFTTSDDAQSLHWKGIYVNSADGRNILNYVSLSYAGNSTMNFSGTDFAAGVGVDTNGKISITNSVFSNNTGYAVYADDGGGQLEAFEANTFEMNDRAVGVPADEADAIDGASVFTDNTHADVEIFATTYAEAKASTWQKLNGTASYRVSGNVDVNGELTISPGAILTFDENVILRVYGSLTAEGTSSDRITFTTSNLDGDIYWKGIYISSGTSMNSFAYVDLSYAGNSTMNFSGTDYAAGIGVDASGKVSVTNSDLSNNKDYGLYIDDGGGQLESFSDNNFTFNVKGVGVPVNEVDAIDGNTTFSDNSFASVEIFSTTLSGTKDVSWNALSGDAFYRVTGNLALNGNVTVLPGASFEMDEDVQITVNGVFIAEGSEANIITFTSSNTAGGLLWKGLFFKSADSRNTLDYVKVAHAGNSTHNFSGSDFAANVGVDSGAQLEITNSVISNSNGYGIYSKGTTNDFLSAAANNTFTNLVNGNNL